MGVLSKHFVASMLGVTLAGIISAGFSAQVFAVGAQSELADIVARMDYGYYAGEARLIEAARGDLERSREGGGLKAYYLGYAAYRLSQLGAADSQRGRRDLITSCLDFGAEAMVDSNWTLEAWILVAACSLQGHIAHPARKLSYELRLANALAAAQALNQKNPRLLLVSALAASDADSEKGAENRRQTLERARIEFDAWQGAGLAPTWGKAETLADLGEVYLEFGQLREARDLIEQSLIEAPDYHVALELRNALSLRR